MDDAVAALHERIERSLTNITPDPNTIEKIEALRVTAKVLGHQIVESVPGSREQSLALTHLEDAVMWGVKGLVLASRESVTTGYPVTPG